MFEDSLMESNQRHKAVNKYWPFLSLCINGLAICLLMLWPLLHPEALPTQITSSLLVAPSPPPPPAPPAPPAVKMPIHSEILRNELQAPSRIPKGIKQIRETATAPVISGVQGIDVATDGPANSMNSIIGSIGTGSSMVVKAAVPQTLKLSSGVMAGYLLEKIAPQYPSIAKAARIQGTVVLQATIAKSGQIENLRTITGPPMLVQAALDAVRSWRYKPYLLNGSPVEVETTINVVFNLGE